MQVCKILFGDIELATISSAEELEKILTQVRRNFEPPHPILEMIHPTGSCLTLGISSEGCLVQYTTASKNPPYFVSLGDPTRLEEAEVVYFDLSGQGHRSEILRRHIIAFEDLLRVAKSFYASGKRPETVIEWEML